MKYGNNYEFKTTEQAYECGYNKGMEWDAGWTPGGPFVYTYQPHETDADWIEFCNFTDDCSKSWLDGWKDGFNKSGKKLEDAPKQLKVRVRPV